MEEKINWMLFNNDKLLICKQNVTAFYEYKKKITYKTDTETNTYYYNTNIYTRKTNELDLEIDFNNKLCTIKFPEEGTCKFDIKCHVEVTEDKITLKYSVDEEEKKIVIEFTKK